MTDVTWTAGGGAPGEGPSQGPNAGPDEGAGRAGLSPTQGFRASLRSRPPLSMVGVLAAMAGALGAIAAVVLLDLPNRPSAGKVIAVGAALLVLGLTVALAASLIGARSPATSRLAELVPMGTLLALAGAPLLVAGLVQQVVDDDRSLSTSLAWWPTLVVAVILLALWVIPGLQGRPTILAVGLLAATWTLAAFVAVHVGLDKATPFDTGDGTDLSPSPFLQFTNGLSDALRAGAIVALCVGVALLLLAALADRTRLPGLGTPLLVAGAISGAIGAYGVHPDQAVVAVLIPLAVVVVFVAVGVAGSRKATTWIGAIIGVSLISQLAVALLGDHPSTGSAGTLIGLFGLLALVGAIAVATVRSPRTGDPSRTPPPPAPPAPAAPAAPAAIPESPIP